MTLLKGEGRKQARGRREEKSLKLGNVEELWVNDLKVGEERDVKDEEEEDEGDTQQVGLKHASPAGLWRLKHSF